MDSAEKPYYDPYKLDVFELFHHLDHQLEDMKKEGEINIAGEVAVLKYQLRLRDVLHKRVGLPTGGDHVLAS